MEYKQLGEFLPDQGLVAVATFRTEWDEGVYAYKHYLDVHKVLRDRLMSHKQYLATKGMHDIDCFVLLVLNAIGVDIPEEYMI